MRFLCLLFLICLTAKTTPLVAQLPDSAVWNVDAQWFTTDRLQNIYLIDENSGVRKWTPTGPSPFLYTNQELGTLQQLDATDPFNLLLYYPDFMVAVQLDRTLNERSRLSFPDLGFPQVSCIAKSRDNQIWAYDQLRSRLIKINAQGSILAESQNLSLLPQGAPLRPNQLFAAGNYVYLYDAQQGVLVFDAFGQYTAAIPLTGKTAVQTLSNQLVLRDNEECTIISGTKHFQTIALPVEVPTQAIIRLTRNHLLYLDRNNLYITRHDR